MHHGVAKSCPAIKGEREKKKWQREFRGSHAPFVGDLLGGPVDAGKYGGQVCWIPGMIRFSAVDKMIAADVAVLRRPPRAAVGTEIAKNTHTERRKTERHNVRVMVPHQTKRERTERALNDTNLC